MKRNRLVPLAFAAMALLQAQKSPEALEQEIEARLQAGNGITVGNAKVYDDSVLQQMLNAALARLGAMQALDQAGVSQRLGSVTGASQQISAFALSVQGPPIPGAVTTNTGTAQSTVTTEPQLNPPVAAVPAATTSLPSAYSVSASDVLSEQVQLTYEIANLRLLLEGSLSDRVLKQEGHMFVRPRVTLGFPIAISPDKRFRHAVAVVEVTVETEPSAAFKVPEPPAILALLPREKTYNVAAITDRSISIGGGVATQIAGISGSFLRGRKTYYIVKDQDTVALTFATGNAAQCGVEWQFRPVLGQPYVQAGLKQTFLQLAFPSSNTAAKIGTVRVRTYWRSFDAKKGIETEMVPGSAREQMPVDVPSISLEADVTLFNASQLEDLGNGQMLVKVPGMMVGGTYIRVGSTVLQPGSPGFTSEYRMIRFVAPIADLATKQTYVVSRDGTEVPLLFEDRTLIPENRPVIQRTTATPIDGINCRLEIRMAPSRLLPSMPLIVVVGGKVFGYSDAPIERDGNTLRAIVPISLLAANPRITVKPLMVRSQLADTAVVKIEPQPTAETERLSLLESDGRTVRYLLQGTHLSGIQVMQPAGIQLQPAGAGTNANVVRVLELRATTARNVKEILLQRPGGKPILLPLPKTEGEKPRQKKRHSQVRPLRDK